MQSELGLRGSPGWSGVGVGSWGEADRSVRVYGGSAVWWEWGAHGLGAPAGVTPRESEQWRCFWLQATRQLGPNWLKLQRGRWG